MHFALVFLVARCLVFVPSSALRVIVVFGIFSVVRVRCALIVFGIFSVVLVRFALVVFGHAVSPFMVRAFCLYRS